MKRNFLQNVRKEANIIGSHHVYKIKIDINESQTISKTKYKLKSRLRIHRNRDAERYSMRSDASVLSHQGFRILYSVAEFQK